MRMVVYRAIVHYRPLRRSDGSCGVCCMLRVCALRVACSGRRNVSTGAALDRCIILFSIRAVHYRWKGWHMYLLDYCYWVNGVRQPPSPRRACAVADRRQSRLALWPRNARYPTIVRYYPGRLSRVGTTVVLWCPDTTGPPLLRCTGRA